MHKIRRKNRAREGRDKGRERVILKIKARFEISFHICLDAKTTQIMFANNLSQHWNFFVVA
jgi:hypothetical protein